MSVRLNLQARQAQAFRIGQVVSLMQMTVDELDTHLSDASQSNPMLIFNRRGANGGATDILETTAIEQGHSLYQHVLRELAGLIAQGGLMERLIVALIAELEPSGWLGETSKNIASSLSVSETLVETALRVVQKKIEPAGLFARNLEECLRLQLEDREAMFAEMDQVLGHLTVLEAGGPSLIAIQTGLDERTVRDCLSILRTLDPKPGSSFAFDPALQRDPDVRIVPTGKGWAIEYLNTQHNDVEVVTLPRGSSSEARKAIAEARALKQAYDLRRSAMKQVVETLVDHQTHYFLEGLQALRPLTLSEIAEATGFHLSTVSRVLNGLLIEGPNGIVLARELFSGTVSLTSTHSKPSVQARIRSLLASEDPQKPLSDRRLVTLLQQDGISVSRRVVSTYRHEIGILSAAKRRVHA